MKRVFVSSTYVDLKEIREEVRTGLRRLDYVDVAMEYFVAEDSRPVDKCIELVNTADLYVGIFAWRYGHIPDTSDVSITELEYRAAAAAGVPCIILLLSDEAPWPAKFVDVDRRRIDTLRSQLKETHVVATFRNRADVLARLYEALQRQERSQGRIAGLGSSTKAFEETVAHVVIGQQRLHEHLRLFDLQRDIAVSDIYVQEILDAKTQNGPYALLEPSRNRVKSERIHERTILESLRSGDGKTGKTRICTIEGRAGSGKSTMQKMWLLTELKSAGTEGVMIPLYLALRYLTKPQTGERYLWLYQTLCRTTPCLSESMVRGMLDAPAALLQRRRFLVLADGFDEAPLEMRREFLLQLDSLPSHVSAVVSTRPGLFSEAGYPSGARAYELCDFTIEQIREFLGKWFAAQESTADDLANKIQGSTALFALARIPLLLTCLAMHVELHGTSSVAGDTSEGDLIRSSVEILIDRWDAGKEARMHDARYVLGALDLLRSLAGFPSDCAIPVHDLLLELPLSLHGQSTAGTIERLLANGRVVTGNLQDGVRFAHSVFYDYFFATRLQTSS